MRRIIRSILSNLDNAESARFQCLFVCWKQLVRNACFDGTAYFQSMLNAMFTLVASSKDDDRHLNLAHVMRDSSSFILSAFCLVVMRTTSLCCMSSSTTTCVVNIPTNIYPALQDRHPSGKRRHCGGQSGHLFTSSGPSEAGSGYERVGSEEAGLWRPTQWPGRGWPLGPSGGPLVLCY